MAKTAHTHQAALGDALDEEIIRLERVVALSGIILAGAGVILSVYTALFVSRALGLPLMAFALVLLGWFAAVRLCLGYGVGPRVFQWLNPLAEITIPTALVLIDTRTQGPEYALASPVPLQFYVVFCCVAVLRLKRWMPLLVGAVAAVQYALVYLAVIRPQMPAALLEHPAYRTDMILMRSVVLLLAGGVGTLVGMAIRRAVGQASSEVRSHELFGKYRIGEQVAAGGMGVVYRALYCPEGGFKRQVALKRVHPHLMQFPHLVEAFRNEAELCARLVHPNIVQVLDFGRIENTYFLAMEYVDGMTLLEVIQRARVSRENIPSHLVAWMAREICKGLAFAHRGAVDEQGQVLRVIHRDLNPPNILVSHGGQVKIFDFGIAKALKTMQQSNTQSVVGKMSYMAPEQISGRPIDERVDLFAASIIIWELLCLRPLFNREEDAATMYAVLEAPIPSATTLRPSLSERWEAFMRKGLQREADKRFQTADEMAAALGDILTEEGTPQPDELQQFLARLPAPPPPRVVAPTAERVDEKRVPA
ncbi:MAG: serine/threonine-protein kinase [Myxococcota bacterium]